MRSVTATMYGGSVPPALECATEFWYPPPIAIMPAINARMMQSQDMQVQKRRMRGAGGRVEVAGGEYGFCVMT